MNSVNLIPAPRRDAKRRRRHRNLCAGACGAYAVLLACALGVAHLMWSGAGKQLDEELAAADAAIKRSERQAADARSELASARTTIEANRTVAEQPDWSVLLALLATTTGQDVVLRTVTVAPATLSPAAAAAAAKSPSTAPPPEVILELHGVGRTQVAVQQHVLRLEQTGLFAKVALLDTGRESFLESPAIAFRLQCNFGEPQQPRPLSTAATSTEGVGR